MLVFRDERETLPGRALAERVARELSQLRNTSGKPDHAALAALLRAGELECALADAYGQSPVAQSITDMLASAVLGYAEIDVPRVQCLLRALDVPASVHTKRPEGYAFYALDPRAYAQLAREHDCRRDSLLVLGVRSIGTSLSALVASVFEQRGLSTHRLTVRPAGHPWARSLKFAAHEAEIIAAHRSRGADFVIVDEGPGMSGSTLLSCAEALLSQGVSAANITIFCSHLPDPSVLVAERARERWQQFSVKAVNRLLEPPDSDLVDWSAGAWRASIYGQNAAAYPACWPEQERLKYLNVQRGRLYKFQGLPPYERSAHSQAELLAEAGFGPQPLDASNGFLSFAFVDGTPLGVEQLDTEHLSRMAEYVALRARAFPRNEAVAEALEEMTRANVKEALNYELSASFALALEHPSLTDSRMLPHEWIRPRGSAAAIKADALDHGDGHLFPGPTDICWDLAGAIVEWSMNEAQMAHLLDRHQAASGDRVRSRLPAYLIAYSAFRVGYAQFAARSASEADALRNAAAGRHYVRQLVHWLKHAGERVPDELVGHSASPVGAA